MNRIITSFISFVEGYFNAQGKNREKNIIYKRFGIMSNKKYTLDELGILYDGISKERIRQIESKEIGRLKKLVFGEKIKRLNYISDISLVNEVKRVLEFCKRQRAIKRPVFTELVEVEKNQEAWENLLLKLLSITITTFDFLAYDVLSVEGIDHKVLKREINRVYNILKKNIIYMSIDDIIIEAKRNRRNFDADYIRLAVKCLDTETINRDGVDLYGIKVDNSFSAGDLAYRVLWEEDTPLSSLDIFTIINKKYEGNNIKSLRNVENQIIRNVNIVNIGAKKWALKEWNLDKKYIKEMIIDVLLKEGKPMQKKKIVELIRNARNDIKKNSIISYLSYDDFMNLNDGRVILTEWKSKYSTLLKEKRLRQDFDKLLLDTYNYYNKDTLTTDEIWNFIKVKFEGKKYYIKLYTMKRKYVYHENKNGIDYWTLKDNYLDIMQKSHGNKLNEIKKMAQQIISENRGTMKLVDLRNYLINKYKFNDKSVYRALNDDRKFTKFSLEQGSMLISLINLEYDGIKLMKVSEKEFEDFINTSKSEEAQFDFKQGFLDLSHKRKLDQKSFDKIMKNVCAMANHGVNIKGRLFIGVCDNENDAKRIEKMDNIMVPIINGFGIAGLEREAVKLGYDLEKYQNYILEQITTSKIPNKLKNHLKSNMGYIYYKGKFVLMMELACIDGPSLYDNNELYIRKGPNLELISNDSSEVHDIYRRCFVRID